MTLQEGLQELMTIDGALGAMVVDASSGMTLGMAGAALIWSWRQPVTPKWSKPNCGRCARSTCRIRSKTC